MERRHFLGAVIAAGILPDALPARQQNSRIPLTSSPGELRGEMLYRKLGSTGETVSAIGLGGSHISKATVTEAEATKLIHEAIDRGITFMDNSWDYNEGRGERYMGEALSRGGYRNRVFLMTKIDGRTKDLAARQIDESLIRLKTDHIDLLQHHEVLRFDDPDRIFAEGGSMEAVLQAKKAGKVRFIGFTGHKDPRVHLYMLEVAAKHGFNFDTVQMPLNVMDAHFRSFAQLVVPKLVEQGIGVLGMKTFGGGDGIILRAKPSSP
jgi:aryl-alcohol dehydrogenase-like predicted oxidoreductase